VGNFVSSKTANFVGAGVGTLVGAGVGDLVGVKSGSPGVSTRSHLSRRCEAEEKLGAGGGSTSTPATSTVEVVVRIPESRGVVGQLKRKPTGSGVGLGVGLGVGMGVGLGVVGSGVGWGVGNAVGANVGTLVGAVVGNLVGVKSGSSGVTTRSHVSLSLPLLTKYLIRACVASLAFPAEPMGVTT
jgi:hypothetical protein